MNTANNDAWRQRILDEEIREHPLLWAPCYEAPDSQEKETAAFSHDAVQWSVCGMLLAKMSGRPTAPTR